MDIRIHRVPLDDIRTLRTLFLHELNRQFVYDKCHRYGWADTYLFEINGRAAGCSALWGSPRDQQNRDKIFEYYLLPPLRRHAHVAFQQLVAETGATTVESQSNDALLSLMLYAHTVNIRAEAILFEDHITTRLSAPDVSFRELTAENDDTDDVACHLERSGEVVATGGLMLNYNHPYADIYMEVNEAFRAQGYGSFIVQEIKAMAYRRQRVPAARCNILNRISQNTLEKAGLAICGYRLSGDIRKD